MPESKKDKIVAALKNLASVALGTDETVEAVESKFMDAKLVDGSIVRYDAEILETGVVVMVVGEDGSVLPLPQGTYALEDGTSFDVVDDMGAIDNVVLAEIAEEAPETEEVMEESTAVTEAAPVAKAITESVVKKTEFEAEVETEVEATPVVETEVKAEAEVVEEVIMVTEESFTAYKAEKDAEVAELKDMVKAIFTAVEEISKEDVVASTETKTNVFKAAAKKYTAKEIRRSFQEQLKG